MNAGTTRTPINLCRPHQPVHSSLTVDRPPVKDKRCFDWAGVKYTIQKLRGRLLSSAPKWQRLGIEAYEKFTCVFFLDRIERVSGGDALGERFRSLQLRARDGALDEGDYRFMKEHMMLAGREDEFAGPQTYKLVTTQNARDERNNEEFEAALECGTPSITIPALNSGPVAMAADDEDMGNLPNELHLCLGARVMISRNLCVDHGLCNGTIGLVHDIIVNDKGIVEAVVLKVRRASPTQDGYKGPSFSDHTEGVNPATEVLIAVNRRSSDIWNGDSMEQRQQFPLMLAWALTIHKAQGLTLERVIIDAGDDEASVGLLFVAMTRVRHPTHIAFSPWPGIERVTSIIARKPALKQRKEHEAVLRGLAMQTAERLGRPPAPAHVGVTLRLGGLPPARVAIVAPQPAKPQAATPVGVTPQTQQVSDRLQHPNPQQKRKPPPKPPPSSAKQARKPPPPKEKQKRKRPAEGTDPAEAARQLRQQEFNTNRAVVASHSLPQLNVPMRSPQAAAPSLPVRLWAATNCAGLKLEARVVDFWEGSQRTRNAIQSWLRDLGFDVIMTDDCAQVGPACGYVAACATNLMFAAGERWHSVDVSDAAAESWINLGNKTLKNDAVGAEYLDTNEVYLLTQVFREEAFREEASPAGWGINDADFPCMRWPLTVGSTDWVAREISNALMAYVADGAGASPVRHFFVSNTHDSRGGGGHWISIAISMRWQEESPPVFELPRLLSKTAQPLPPWTSGLHLAARIIDFGPGGATTWIGEWLRTIGFSTVMTICGSTKMIKQLTDTCPFIVARVAADVFSAGADWLNVNVDAAVAPGVIDQVSTALIANGSRSRALTLPIERLDEPDWMQRSITVSEACLCASLFTGQPPGAVAGWDSVGHMPQDALKHIAGAMRAVANGGPPIAHERPAIIVANGNLRPARNVPTVCHAIVIAFSIERT